MRLFVLKSAVVAACVFSFLVPSFAQRHTQGRPSIEGQVLFGERMDNRFVAVNGGSVTWNNYQYIGHTSLGLEFYTHPQGFTVTVPAIKDDAGNILAPEDVSVNTHRAYDITAGGGYFFRVISTRNRFFIVSVGASLYVGVRHCKEIGGYVKEQNTGKHYSSTGFLLNAIPEVQMEFFPFSNISLYVSARPRICIVSTLAGSYDWFHFTFGSGVKYYF